MHQGRVIKAAGGFFSVRNAEGEVYLCRARGTLKRQHDANLIVGDWVAFDREQDNLAPGFAGTGIIEQLLPRKNELYRPQVANVDQLVIVSSFRQPVVDWQLVSRLSVLAEYEEIDVLVALNKVDLASEKQLENLDLVLEHYPYPVLRVSALLGTELATLKEGLAAKCSVLAGPSGSGKSSLLNALQPGLSLQTGSVSVKIERGRHTTRQAELLFFADNGSVVDTPGFTRLDFSGIDPDQLPFLFPEFVPLLRECSFRNCRHLTEPDCAVRQQVGSVINPMRYEHYRYFSKELAGQEAY